MACEDLWGVMSTLFDHSEVDLAVYRYRCFSECRRGLTSRPVECGDVSKFGRTLSHECLEGKGCEERPVGRDVNPL